MCEYNEDELIILSMHGKLVLYIGDTGYYGNRVK